MDVERSANVFASLIGSLELTVRCKWPSTEPYALAEAACESRAGAVKGKNMTLGRESVGVGAEVMQGTAKPADQLGRGIEMAFLLIDWRRVSGRV